MTALKSASVLPGKDSDRIFGLLFHEWITLSLVSIALVLFLALWNLTITLWIGFGCFLTLMVLGHLCLVAERYVAFPGLIAFAGCLQWVIAPWLSEFYPPNFPLFVMVIPIDQYLGYAVPATAAFWLGLHWSVRKILKNAAEVPGVNVLPPAWFRILDGIILVGLILGSLARWVPAGFRFFIYVLASFRFFGALCWMLTGKSGWKLRVGVVFIHSFLQAAAAGIFYQVLHWGGYFALIYGFRQRWRWKMALMLSSAILCLGFLQAIKQEYRTFLEEEEEIGGIERIQELQTLIQRRVLKLGKRESVDTTFGDVLVRFNQGWIIARIMDQVPAVVPYAHGKTLRDAAFYTIVPRALSPEKREGASKELFTLYTGLPLRPWTSMGLGLIGELYANFGIWGGVVATLVYGVVVGLLFSWFFTKSSKSVFWWALAPVVLLPAVEPGWNVEDISNHVFKALIVVLISIWSIPWLRRILGLGSEMIHERVEGPTSLSHTEFLRGKKRW